MNPYDKLKEIEARNNVGREINVYELLEDKSWLISRVKRLTEALERVSNPKMSGIDGMIIVDMGLQHFVSHTARKALEGDE